MKQSKKGNIRFGINHKPLDLEFTKAHTNPCRATNFEAAQRPEILVDIKGLSDRDNDDNKDKNDNNDKGISALGLYRELILSGG